MHEAAGTESNTWVLELVGIVPSWIVLPIALATFLLLRFLVKPELVQMPRWPAKAVAWGRSITGAILVLLLLEPTLTYVSTYSTQPTVVVLVDTSASMAVHDRTMNAFDRLNEAVESGLVPPHMRNSACMETDALLEKISTWGLRMVKHLNSAQAGSASLPDDANEFLRDAEQYAEELRSFASRLAIHGNIASPLDELSNLISQSIECLRSPKRPGTPPLFFPKILLQRWRTQLAQIQDLRKSCLRTQRTIDAALVTGVDEDSPIAKGLATLDEMSRFERSLRLYQAVIRPSLAPHAELRVLALDKGLTPLPVDTDTSPRFVAGLTDFAAPLSALARLDTPVHLGAIILLSDGRQTTGIDPASVLRNLHSRGILLGAVVVGDPETPRDAVVGKITGATEIFRGETIRLNVPYRITGFDRERWHLVLTHQGKEIAKREVRATGEWINERFEFPAKKSGVLQFQVLLEQQEVINDDRQNSGLLREVWTEIEGTSVEDLHRSPAFPEMPTTTGLTATFQTEFHTGDMYGQRLRGWIAPPYSGSYIFSIASDDNSELWLSSDHHPENMTLISGVRQWTNPGEWDKYPSQTSEPVQLRAHNRYYVEVLHKEGTGGDHVAVGWQRPDGVVERPIPGMYLDPWSASEVVRGSFRQAAEREASLDNNQAQFMVDVSEDPLRVLLLDAHPRWESRYLMNLLERDRRVKLIRRFGSIRLSRGDASILPEKQSDFDAFDALILGDLTPQELPPDAQQRIVDFVSQRGGFLIILSGARGMPHDYSLGPLTDVLPVTIRHPAKSSLRIDTVPARLRLTAQGDTSTITHILDNPALNRKLWPALPAIQRIRQDITPKIGSTVLVQTDAAAGVPIVVIARQGAGRILYMGTDESWRWRTGLGDRIHQAFWLQAMRWGLSMRLRGNDPRLQVSLDRSIIQPDESATVRARVLLQDGTPLSTPPLLRRVRLNDKGEPRAETEQHHDLSRIADSSGVWHTPLTNLSEGVWRLTITADHPQLNGLSETRQLRVQSQLEREGLNLGNDLPALQKMAATTGFRATNFSGAKKLANELATHLHNIDTDFQKTWSLWDNYFVLILVGSLLLCEWLLRKRYGLP